MTQEEEYRRGEQARLILENEIYTEAFEGVRAALISKWEDAPIRDIEGQKELKLMLKLLKDVQANIQHVMNTGKLAKNMIERESVFRKTVNRFK